MERIVCALKLQHPDEYQQRMVTVVAVAQLMQAVPADKQESNKLYKLIDVFLFFRVIFVTSIYMNKSDLYFPFSSFLAVGAQQPLHQFPRPACI